EGVLVLLLVALVVLLDELVDALVDRVARRADAHLVRLADVGVAQDEVADDLVLDLPVLLRAGRRERLLVAPVVDPRLVQHLVVVVLRHGRIALLDDGDRVRGNVARPAAARCESERRQGRECEQSTTFHWVPDISPGRVVRFHAAWRSVTIASSIRSAWANSSCLNETSRFATV